jgi:precorrin-6B methylase 2
MEQPNPCFVPTGAMYTDVIALLWYVLPMVGNVVLNVIALKKLIAVQRETRRSKRILEERKVQIEHDRDNFNHLI